MGSTQPDIRAQLDRDGFVVLRQVVPGGEQLELLRAACAHVAYEARSGRWPHIRTLPKQFPPWPSAPGAEGIWGVQHLLHPALPLPSAAYGDPVSAAAALQESYFGDTIVEPVRQILGCDTDGLVMELYNLLVRPQSDFALRWHRDDVPPDATPEQEAARLGVPADDAAAASTAPARRYAHAQWNLALYEDESLIVVPGSHRRVRTPAEYAALEQDPWAADDGGLPGQLVVRLGPGDAVFYDNNILHRGVYDSARERLTLHGSMSRAGAAADRARNVLQHGVGDWVHRCDFGTLEEPLRARAEGMRRRLLDMGRQREMSGRAVEYSQPD